MGEVSSKMFYYGIYILIFTVGLIYVFKFTQVEARYVVRLEDLEDGVIVNRVVGCFSEDNNFGIINEAKFDVSTLQNCFGDSGYGFKIKLIKKRASGGTSKLLEVGNIDNLIEIKRYVLVETNEGLRAARLEVGYNKNEI